jgi:hypothetical protein
MELYIQIKNGQPFEHPIFEENFRQAFPNVDTNNLPAWAAKFERINPPSVKPYEIYEGVTYEWVDGVVKDIHHVREMNTQEKQEKQEKVKIDWATNGFASWVFDEITCSFKSPTSYPDDGQRYSWDEATTSWKVME